MEGEPIRDPIDAAPPWADTDPTLPPVDADPTPIPVDEDLTQAEADGHPTPPPLADVSPVPPPEMEGELEGRTGAARLDAAGDALTLALPLRGRRVLVVGGGASATQIVDALCESGALVRVLAFTLSPRLTELAARGLIEVANRQYQARDLADAWLAFACSEHRSVNAALAFDAEHARIWCVTPEDIARPPPTAANPPTGRRALVLGGARSGKSATAEAMLADCADVDHVAIGHRPGDRDEECDERFRGHEARPPAHWRTVETLDLAPILAKAEPSAAVLIDCVATWLSHTMDDCGLWAGNYNADKQLATRLDELVHAWTTTPRRVVAVSSEVGSGVVPATQSGRRFRDELGWLNTRLAATADEVWLCIAGIANRLK